MERESDLNLQPTVDVAPQAPRPQFRREPNSRSVNFVKSSIGNSVGRQVGTVRGSSRSSSRWSWRPELRRAFNRELGRPSGRRCSRELTIRFSMEYQVSHGFARRQSWREHMLPLFPQQVNAHLVTQRCVTAKGNEKLRTPECERSSRPLSHFIPPSLPQKAELEQEPPGSPRWSQGTCTSIERQMDLPVEYRGIRLDCG